MAIFSCHVSVHSRSREESASGGAAYRLGLRIEEGMTLHDYTRRKDIAAAFTVLPAGSPAGWDDPVLLASKMDDAEKRKNSCVAREVLVALPAEMTGPEREALTRGIADHLVEKYGVAVLCGVHLPEKKGRNHHAHILMSTRRLTPDGFGEKTRELDEKKQGAIEVQHIRESVAELTNEALKQGGYEARVDHRTLEAQEIDAWGRGDIEAAIELDRAPTKHEGRNPTVRALVQVENAEIRVNNKHRQDNAEADFLAFMEQAKKEARLMPANFDIPNREPYGRLFKATSSTPHLAPVGAAIDAHGVRSLRSNGAKSVLSMHQCVRVPAIGIPGGQQAKRGQRGPPSSVLYGHASGHRGPGEALPSVRAAPLNQSRAARFPTPKKNVLAAAMASPAPMFPSQPSTPTPNNSTQFRERLNTMRSPLALPLTPAEQARKGPKPPTFGRGW